MNSNGFLSLGEAAERAGLDRRTLNNRVQAAGVDVYIGGKDRRLRLIRAADISRLTAIQLVERRETVTGEARK